MFTKNFSKHRYDTQCTMAESSKVTASRSSGGGLDGDDTSSSNERKSKSKIRETNPVLYRLLKLKHQRDKEAKLKQNDRVLCCVLVHY